MKFRRLRTQDVRSCVPFIGEIEAFSFRSYLFSIHVTTWQGLFDEHILPIRCCEHSQLGVAHRSGPYQTNLLEIFPPDREARQFPERLVGSNRDDSSGDITYLPKSYQRIPPSVKHVLVRFVESKSAFLSVICSMSSCCLSAVGESSPNSVK